MKKKPVYIYNKFITIILIGFKFNNNCAYNVKIKADSPVNNVTCSAIDTIYRNCAQLSRQTKRANWKLRLIAALMVYTYTHTYTALIQFPIFQLYLFFNVLLCALVQKTAKQFACRKFQRVFFQFVADKYKVKASILGAQSNEM